MIFVQPFDDNFYGNLFFSIFLLVKNNREREKNEEREKKLNVSMKKNVVQKLSQNNCSNIISLGIM